MQSIINQKQVLWIQNFDIENLLQYLFSSFTMLNLTSGVNPNVRTILGELTGDCPGS